MTDDEKRMRWDEEDIEFLNREKQRALKQTFKDKTDDTNDAADLPRVQQTKARSFLRRFSRKNS